MEGKFKGIAEGIGGGLVAGALVLAVYFLISANATGADGGDWLNFAGVIFGVMATVGGAMAIERISERRRHKRAVRNLRPALQIWTETIKGLDTIPTKANIANLREQIAYITTLTADLDRDLPHVTMTSHAFCFHIPAMVEKLSQVADDGPSPTQAVVITIALNDMRQYAAVFRQALAIG